MNASLFYAGLTESPIGVIWAATSSLGLVSVRIGGDEASFRAEVKDLAGEMPVLDPETLKPILDQLAGYLAGTRKEFEVSLDQSMLTSFQKEALGIVCTVPYGCTSTYGKIAAELGKPGAARAVGRANATNPMPIIIPCHRVLGSDGKLHGYGGGSGLETKAWLLRLEGSWLL